MKLAALKNADYKQFVVDHGEKVAVGLIGLLIAWSLWSTNWTQFPMAPEELAQKAEDVDKTIKNQPWPDEEKKALTGYDLAGPVEALLSPVNIKPLELTVPFLAPLHPDRVKITKPAWFAVEHPIATYGLANLQLNPNVEKMDEGFVRKTPKDQKGKDKDKPKAKKPADKPSDKPGDDAASDEFAPKNAAGAGGAVKGGFGSIAFGARPRLDKNAAKPDKKGKGSNALTGRKRKRDGEEERIEAEVPTTEKPPKPNARGYRFVAVRAVFPLDKQVTELKQKMAQPTMTSKEALNYINFADFKLERQMKQPRPDEWGGPWKPVDRESAIDLLTNDILDFDPDPIADAVLDIHICMPLPNRFVGPWGRLATHPDIANYELPPEQMEAQVQFERRALEILKEQEDKEKGPPETGPFAKLSFNTRKMQSKIGQQTWSRPQQQIQTNVPFKEGLLAEMKKGDKADQEAIDAKLEEYIKTHATPADHLLLFRYFDFTVEPGNTYRYRVRLVVHNPFKDKHPEEVADPSLLEGEFRDTDYSEPTEPVYVPKDSRYFIARVDSRVGRGTLPGADIDLYEWFESTGTVVNKVLPTQIGQFLGGKMAAAVLRPAEDLFETEKVPFSTSDALVDVVSGFSLDPNLHADILEQLKETKSAAIAKKSGPTVPDEILVVDEKGELTEIDGMDQKDDHEKVKARYVAQNKPYEELKKKPDEKDEKDGNRLDLRNIGPGRARPLKKDKNKSTDPRRKAAVKRKGGGGGRGAGGGGDY